MVSLVMPYRLRLAGEVITNTANCPCGAREEKVMSLSVSARPGCHRNPGAVMESFIHLRKGKTPR
ncbi:MAG TPA: hypothetical protein VN871_15550, partial [Mycobacterium sp.]|nr:hypothetical protein [Mycobacterium sp.]